MCEEAQYQRFFIFWALKEAYIKAIGMGLGYDLLRVNEVLHLLCRCIYYYIFMIHMYILYVYAYHNLPIDSGLGGVSFKS